jgi:hypothetical protein
MHVPHLRRAQYACDLATSCLKLADALLAVKQQEAATRDADEAAGPSASWTGQETGASGDAQMAGHATAPEESIKSLLAEARATLMRGPLAAYSSAPAEARRAPEAGAVVVGAAVQSEQKGQRAEAKVAAVDPRLHARVARVLSALHQLEAQL